MRFNSRLIFLLIIGALIITSGLYIASQKNSSGPVPTTSQGINKTDGGVMDVTEIPSQDPAPTASRYVQYSSADFTSPDTTRRVLFFYASWCPTCKQADEGFISLQDQIPEDVKVIRVNYNDDDTDSDEKALAAKYGVTYQHTFVQIDSEGIEVAKWNGGDLDTLLENMR